MVKAYGIHYVKACQIIFVWCTVTHPRQNENERQMIPLKLAAPIVALLVCASCSKPEKPAHGESPPEPEIEESQTDSADSTDNDTVEVSQGHGKIEAGKEGYLSVKLPFNDKGATVVRAWIGLEDRTQSEVGKTHYAQQSDAYFIHAMAPDPLPEGAQWWVEIEKPDGSKTVNAYPLK